MVVKKEDAVKVHLDAHREQVKKLEDQIDTAIKHYDPTHGISIWVDLLTPAVKGEIARIYGAAGWSVEFKDCNDQRDGSSTNIILK